jgi:hypothetical protein
VLLLTLLIALVVLGPHLWVKWVIRSAQKPADRYPGNGASFARHLLDKYGLENVRVETTTLGDHYDPSSKTVRLVEPHYSENSLAAVTIAAHEVGHAIQDADQYLPLITRSKLAPIAGWGQRIAVAAVWMMPIATAIIQSPVGIRLLAVVTVVGLLFATLLHLITLPVEWDASFKRAWPALRAGNYLKAHDYSRAKRLLTAAALTYVAAALVSVLNWRFWMQVLRR